MNRQKILIILIVSFIVLPLILVTVFTARSSINSAQVRFITAPVDIVVSYEDEAIRVSNEDVLSLPPGEYIFGFSREGFEMIEEKHTLTKDEMTTIPVLLNPATDQASVEMNNDENQIALQGVADYNHHLEEEAAQTNPTINQLPYQNYLFEIDYKPNPNAASGEPDYIITVDAPDIYKMSAVYYLDEIGYTASDYIYEFKGYQNPFAPKEVKS